MTVCFMRRWCRDQRRIYLATARSPSDVAHRPGAGGVILRVTLRQILHSVAARGRRIFGVAGDCCGHRTRI